MRLSGATSDVRRLCDTYMELQHLPPLSQSVMSMTSPVLLVLHQLVSRHPTPLLKVQSPSAAALASSAVCVAGVIIRVHTKKQVLCTTRSIAA